VNDIIQWLVRNKDGEIDGPLTTVEVVRKIRSGFFMGEEYISRYPSGRWFPISYDENFFSVLIDVLEEELLDRPAQSSSHKAEVTKKIETLKKEFTEAQEKPEVKQLGKAHFEDLDAKTPLIIEMEKEPVKVGRAIQDKKKKKKKRPAVAKKVMPAQPSRRARRARVQALLFFAVIGLAGSIYVLSQGSGGGQGRFHLSRPQFGQQKASRTDIQAGMTRAIQSFRKDTLKDYLSAQDALVEVVSRSNSLDGFAFLCMTYRELWPYSYQDSKDHGTLEKVLRQVQKINPKSPSANICLVVSHWVNGKYDDALRIMDSHLAETPGLIFFNQMTGDIYAARQDYRSASYYFSKVRELWSPPPVWSKALLQEARMYRKQGAHGLAVKLYQKLLKENSSHAVGRIELGLLEFDPYQNIEKAQNYIRSGLSSGVYVPKMIEAEAHLTLARISLVQGNQQQALRLAQKAFSVDSSNEEAKDLTLSLGGVKALKSVNISNANMVYLGEQYMKMKNYTAAQAEFRAAYESNKNNGFAALRAGQALWELNQGKEAVTWLQRSITADPSFILSYIILADYQSARYDYINAIETLKSALNIASRHHGIYRGFALIELRRRNYAGSVMFAKRALELYDTDIDSLIILAQALNEQGEPEEAFQYIQQAMELDGSNELVHTNFAKIIAALQGTESAINYLQTMINKSGKSSYFRALGEILFSEERYGEALQYFFDAITKNPKDKKTLLALAKILQNQKDYERARDFLLEAATLDPSDAEPLFLLGQLYLDSEKNSEARKYFERVIDVNPNYPLSYYYAGQAYLALGQLDQALDMAKQEKLVNPEIPEPYLLAGQVYYKKNQFVLCTEEYQEVLAKGLKTADVYVQIARCYRLYGAFDSAQTMLDLAEQAESGNADIYKELGALFAQKGSDIKALEFYKRYLQLSPQAKDKKVIELEMNKISNREE
jgi:tetratricopeptide (TPR) repeat protein